MRFAMGEVFGGRCWRDKSLGRSLEECLGMRNRDMRGRFIVYLGRIGHVSLRGWMGTG